jgi:hypothetical protein
MSDPNKKLNILWTSADREVALNMVFMYALNSRLHGWWDEVSLIVWGPSARLLHRDDGLRAELEKMQQAGVEILACQACAARDRRADELRRLGVEVVDKGQPLTDLLQADAKLIVV